MATPFLMIVFGFYQPLNRRPRRNRKSPVLRAAFQETHLSPANFVYPLFIHEGWYCCTSPSLCVSLSLVFVCAAYICAFMDKPVSICML